MDNHTKRLIEWVKQTTPIYNTNSYPELLIGAYLNKSFDDVWNERYNYIGKVVAYYNQSKKEFIIGQLTALDRSRFVFTYIDETGLDKTIFVDHIYEIRQPLGSDPNYYSKPADELKMINNIEINHKFLGYQETVYELIGKD